ncbi:hypothetical protein ACFVKB_38325 [Rhodococcus sp. NPDC127530]|uniref:hypothetical protein n=1 Tax=unclassified Rhodococcus (in: high G+C Gram-positive bacteria) TaxID=192944 RepID=UPI003625B812
MKITRPRTKHPAAAEDVGRPRGQQQQTAEREGVGVLHPRQTHLGEPERVADCRQAGEDDRVVQNHHEEANQDNGKDCRLVDRPCSGQGSGEGDHAFPIYCECTSQ